MVSQDLAERIAAILENKPLERMPITRRGPRKPIPRIIRSLVHKRDGWACVKCHSSPWAASTERRVDLLHCDHVVPWSAGGADTTDNLRTLCKNCNEERSNFHDSDVDNYHPMPIVRVCAPCAFVLRDKPADVLTVYCSCRHHISWDVDLRQML